MSKTIIVYGFGPGISSAVAQRFGREGYAVALVARNAERLNAGVKVLSDQGIEAKAFAADVSDPEAARAVVAQAKKAFGKPIGALHWNVYPSVGGDLVTATTAEVRSVFDLSITSLLAAAQAAIPDLSATTGSLLVTNGGLGFFDPSMDEAAVNWNTMGLAMANSAKHKLVAMLSRKLAGENVFVGEVVVTGMVKGSAFDSGNATIDPKDVAEKFWSLAQAKKEMSATI